jgi:chemotaxis protein MotB
MAGHGGRGRKKKAHHEEEHENEERWLVSFADMMTLLMCLFMVLFSMSSVNTSKLEALQRSLQDAFSGRILPGGKAVLESGSNEETEQEAPTPPLPALMPLESIAAEDEPRDGEAAKAAAAREEEEFKRLKRRIDALAKEAGLEGRVLTTVRRRGLVVQLLTDRVFFDSGRAELKTPARKLLAQLAPVLSGERVHPVAVEGHTDAQPVSGGAYRSNWGLSGARAESVVLAFEAGGVARRRMTQIGYAEQQPIATNATPEGRSRNRRVEVVLARRYSDPTDARRRP